MGYALRTNSGVIMEYAFEHQFRGNIEYAFED